jgi:hypothetical protein
VVQGKNISGKVRFYMPRIKECSVVFFVLALLCCTSSFALATDESNAKEGFQKFQHDWVNKLKEHGKYGQQNIQVSEDPDQKGKFVAKYDELKDPTETRIEKTGQKGTPYVGVLHYEKWTYACRGNTPEEAKQGPFQCELQEGITEIFRYSKGKWVY